MEEKDTGTENNEEVNEEQAEFVNIEDESPKDDILPEPAQKHGCLRGCLLPVAIILLIIAVLVILAYPKRDIVRQWLLIRIVSNTQDLVLSDLPEDADKKTITSTFDRIKIAIKEKTVDQQKIKTAIEEYIDNTRREISEEKRQNEINKLMKALDESMHPPDNAYN